MEEEKKITFKELSIGLKIPIVMSWIVGVLWGILWIWGIYNAFAYV